MRLKNYLKYKMKKIYYLIHSTSFGDTLASTPTLRYLSKSHRKKINVVTHNKNVFNNNPYTESTLSFEEFYNSNLSNIVRYESFTNAGRKDGNGIEKKFSHIDTRQLHSMDLGFQLLPDDMGYDYYPNPQSLSLDLPEKLIDEAMALTHIKTKTDLIKIALQNLIQKEKIKDLKNGTHKRARN